MVCKWYVVLLLEVLSQNVRGFPLAAFQKRPQFKAARSVAVKSTSSVNGPPSEPWAEIREASPSICFDLNLKNGAIERVCLRGEGGVEAEAARIQALHPTSVRDTAKGLERSIRKEWETTTKRSKKSGNGKSNTRKVGTDSKAVGGVVGSLPPPRLPAPLAGPTLAAGQALKGVVACFDVGATGLVLEVATSLAAPGAGRGLFVRKKDPKGPDVYLPQGHAVCGYSAKPSASSMGPDGTLDKTILFALASLDADVFYEGQRHSLRGLLKHLDDLVSTGGSSQGPSQGSSPDCRVELAAHVLERDGATGAPSGVAPMGVAPMGVAPTEAAGDKERGQGGGGEDAWCRYLVPFVGADFSGGPEARGRPGGVAGLGDQANDLAVECDPATGKLRIKGTQGGAGSEAAYAAASTEYNALAFRYALSLREEEEDGGGKLKRRVLVPGPPLLVATSAVLVTSALPVELGHAYGYTHWQRQLVDQHRWGN